MTGPNDYMEVTVTLAQFSQEDADIVVAMVAELPYDAFQVEPPCVKCYIKGPLYDRRAFRLVLSGLPFETTFAAAPVPYRNWNADWEKTFRPIVAGGAVTVKLWDDVSSPRTRYNIRLRPEMAFGTGHHETTFMMLESMLGYRDRIVGGTVMDIGCGTGVLAILAAKMGAARVYGVDVDAVAAQSAFDNVHLNRVSRRVETYCGDASLMQAGKYDVILANIHRNVILFDLPTYARSLRPGGILLLSGFYESDCADIISEAHDNGLNLLSVKSRGDWACLHFCQPNRNLADCGVRHCQQ